LGREAAGLRRADASRAAPQARQAAPAARVRGAERGAGWGPGAGRRAPFGAAVGVAAGVAEAGVAESVDIPCARACFCCEWRGKKQTCGGGV
jgi:hypothetical protein